MIKHIMSECSKLVPKEYKTSHSWVGKVIHWELCKKFKFEKTNLRYSESVLENEMHKVLWDFKIQMDQLTSARQPDLVKINNKKKENLLNRGLCCFGDPQSKTERKQKER